MPSPRMYRCFPRLQVAPFQGVVQRPRRWGDSLPRSRLASSEMGASPIGQEASSASKRKALLSFPFLFSSSTARSPSQPPSGSAISGPPSPTATHHPQTPTPSLLATPRHGAPPIWRQNSGPACGKGKERRAFLLLALEASWPIGEASISEDARRLLGMEWIAARKLQIAMEKRTFDRKAV